MPLTPGARLGAYEIVAPLGAGGMGEVYRARDTRLGRDVALKVLPEAFARDADRLAWFEREARTVAGLNHPNIVTLHSVEDDGPIRFLTMELVEGASLDTQIVAGGLPLPRVLELGISLADALSAAHEKGVIHRDLKPANVMVTRDGRVKVLDFGLAKPGLASISPGAAQAATMAATVAATTAGSPVSSPGHVVGTVPYMAPEQLRGEPVDARTDLFALGIVLYELAAGRRPFTGATTADVSSAILRDAPPPLAVARGELPGDLERIVTRCLEKSPRDRYQTALDVFNELRRLKHAMERGEQVAAGAPADRGVASIAVLPFVNHSASAEDEYFSDGLADELLNVLAKIRGLRVAARASAFQFKGKHEAPEVIGRKLNVATLLDGSVRKAGNRARISVQLVSVADGFHLWSETYDRTLDDIFAVQDDIAQSVVRELRTTLLGEVANSMARGEVKAEVVQAAKGRASDPEAHRLYLLARYFHDRRTREDVAKAIAYLEQAIARDPKCALAWVGLAECYGFQADVGWVIPVAEGYRRAREAVDRSLALEPELAEAHAQLGLIRMNHDWDWQGAEVATRRALELAPGDAVMLRRSAVMATTFGRFDEAIALYRRAIELDSISSANQVGLGRALQRAGRLEEAEAAYRQALELSPQRIATRANLALNLLALGRGDDALADAMREPDEGFRAWALSIIYHALGRQAESDESLRLLVEKFGEDSAYQIAEACAMRTETDAAFEWLERAYAQRDAGLVASKTSLQLRSLHGDPRWGAFLAKMKLAD